MLRGTTQEMVNRMLPESRLGRAAPAPLVPGRTGIPPGRILLTKRLYIRNESWEKEMQLGGLIVGARAGNRRTRKGNFMFIVFKGAAL